MGFGVTLTFIKAKVSAIDAMNNRDITGQTGLGKNGEREHCEKISNTH